MDELMSFIDNNAERYLNDLIDLCKKPSVSAQNLGIDECAETLKMKMLDVGLEVHETSADGGNPVLIGEIKGEKSEKELGFYNHYDVQPVDPIELWEAPPFEPTIREGKIYARGASDNKGNIIARLAAVDAIQKVFGKVPISLKFLFEGEEEVGSPTLPKVVKKNLNLLKADAYLWEGDGVDETERPLLSLGAKGILSVELEAHGPSKDAHSSWAPLLPNPAWKLVWALSSIKNREEKILIEGWYDDVKGLSDLEIELLKKLKFDEAEEKRRFGLEKFLRDLTGVESRKALYYGTTCNICGFDSGYKGPGMKTVLPAIAKVKLDFRLVEAQNPDKQFELLKKHLRSLGFGDIIVKKFGGYEAAKTPPDDPFVNFTIEKLREVYASEPVVTPTIAGTSPIYLVRNWMKIPVVSCGGVGYPDSNIHSPNENIRIKDFIRSIKFIATLIVSYAT